MRQDKYELLYATLELMSQNAAQGYTTPVPTMKRLKRLVLQAPRLTFDDTYRECTRIHSELLESRLHQQKQRFNELVRRVLKLE